jgi:hypothetical protein
MSGGATTSKTYEEAMRDVEQAQRDAHVPERTPEKTSDQVGQRPGGVEHNQGRDVRG